VEHKGIFFFSNSPTSGVQSSRQTIGSTREAVVCNSHACIGCAAPLSAALVVWLLWASHLPLKTDSGANSLAKRGRSRNGDGSRSKSLTSFDRVFDWPRVLNITTTHQHTSFVERILLDSYRVLVQFDARILVWHLSPTPLLASPNQTTRLNSSAPRPDPAPQKTQPRPPKPQPPHPPPSQIPSFFSSISNSRAASALSLLTYSVSNAVLNPSNSLTLPPRRISTKSTSPPVESAARSQPPSVARTRPSSWRVSAKAWRGPMTCAWGCAFWVGFGFGLGRAVESGPCLHCQLSFHATLLLQSACPPPPRKLNHTPHNNRTHTKTHPPASGLQPGTQSSARPPPGSSRACPAGTPSSSQAPAASQTGSPGRRCRGG